MLASCTFPSSAPSRECSLLVLAGNELIVVRSFFTWYRPVYNAYMKESSVFFYCYFLFAGFHIAFCTCTSPPPSLHPLSHNRCADMFVGIPSSGSAGLINLISRFASGSIVAGVFCILATVGCTSRSLATFPYAIR